VDTLGRGRGALRQRFFAIMIMNPEMRTVQGAPGERRIETHSGLRRERREPKKHTP